LLKGNLWNSRYNMTLFCFQHIKDFEDLVRTVVTLCDQEEQVRYVNKRTYIHRSMYCAKALYWVLYIMAAMLRYE
jgi:hypothetical protein